MNAVGVSGFLYESDTDTRWNGTVCRIVSRAEPDLMFGMEPCFRVKFADDHERDVLAQCLTPWYSV